MRCKVRPSRRRLPIHELKPPPTRLQSHTIQGSTVYPSGANTKPYRPPPPACQPIQTRAAPARRSLWSFHGGRRASTLASSSGGRSDHPAHARMFAAQQGGQCCVRHQQACFYSPSGCSCSPSGPAGASWDIWLAYKMQCSCGISCQCFVGLTATAVTQGSTKVRVVFLECNGHCLACLSLTCQVWVYPPSIKSEIWEGWG